MKLFIAAIPVVVLIYAFIGLPEAEVFTDIITRFKQNGLMGPGQIPLPVFMFLLATGIIGFLGIGRKG